MNDTAMRAAQIIMLLLVMTLALRALASRRLPAGRLVRLAMIWAGIFIAATATALMLGLTL